MFDKVGKNSLVSDTGFTQEWILDILKEYDPNFTALFKKDASYSVILEGSVKANFLGGGQRHKRK